MRVTKEADHGLSEVTKRKVSLEVSKARWGHIPTMRAWGYSIG